jgi:acylphosphatase
VQGNVQGVMFRQTVIRAMIKRGIVGGASNDRKDKHLVRMTLIGDSAEIQQLVSIIKVGTQLNDWGAQASNLIEVSATQGIPIEQHQVTTNNVDSKKWNPNVTMFI